MLQREHSVILSTFIKLPFVIKIFVLSVFEWPFSTGFTVNLFAIYKNENLNAWKVAPLQTSCIIWYLSTITEKTVCLRHSETQQEENLGFSRFIIFFLFLLKNKGCGYTLDASQWDALNEYPRLIYCIKLQSEQYSNFLRKKLVCI